MFLRTAAVVAATLLLLEIGARVLSASGLLPSAGPRAATHSYWRGDHPTLGVWHAPGLGFRHRSACFDVKYRANSVGSRDRERPLRAEEPRVVVLGDSFLEGWGLPESERLSNLLEEETGVPHLNFAMAHFGPYQQYLAYTELAQRFDHDAVIVGLLPVNDFEDGDYERARSRTDYQFRYRPYLVEDGAEYRHVSWREPAWRRWVRRHTYFGAAFFAGLQSRARARAIAEAEALGARSRFYDHDEKDVRLLVEVLHRIVAAADGRPVIVLLIPTLEDLRHFERIGPAPLAAELAASGERIGFHVVDLLPRMARGSKPWARYYHPCDYHWSAAGNAAAARQVREALGSDFYQGLGGR